MNAADPALAEAVERLFGDLAGSSHDAPAFRAQFNALESVWSSVEEVGVASLLVPQHSGGFGGSWSDVQTVLRLAGFHELTLPIGETLLVRGLLARAGLEPPSGLATFAITDERQLLESSGAVARISGEVPDVPWGRAAQCVLLELSAGDALGRYLVIDRAQIATVRMGANLAGEPRDTLVLRDASVTVADGSWERLSFLGALLRAAQIGGALECILGLSVRHVGERSQFGRPLSQFQAIQQQLAILAEETAACRCAAAAAAAALDAGDGSFEIAAAKLRANLAAARGIFIAHQCHGAIGMTMEHALQRSTRHLWAWRGEFGNDRYWARWLGEQAQRSAAAGLWSMLAMRGDRGANSEEPAECHPG